MTLISAVTVALLGSFVPVAVLQAFATEPPNFQLLDRSVVNVDVHCLYRPDGDGLGPCRSDRATGVVLSERDGLVRVLTARHLVHGVNTEFRAEIKLTFAFDQLKPVPAKLLAVSSEQLDLAVLEAELPKGAAGFGTLPLAWKSDTSLKQGVQLWAVDGKWEKVPGSVVSVIQDQDGQRLRYDSKASAGYSGGPVFDASGDLVAIHLRERSDVAPQLCDGDTLDAVITWLDSIGYSSDSINRIVASTPASSGNYAKPADVGKLRPISAGDRGTLLFRADRFAEARPLLAEAANAGDGHAAMILSGMYLAGAGVALDYKEANHWAQLGAAAGNDVSMSVLGADLVAGVGLEQNYVLGAYWYRKSAELGNASAMTGLALLFANGQINSEGTAARTPRRTADDTDAQAVYWFQRGSQAGDLLARAELGIMYGNGRGGLPKNDLIAVQLFRSAASQGQDTGMFLLGDWYLAGRVDGRRNFEQAIFWFKKAAALGDSSSKKRLQSIAAANPGMRF